MTKPIRYHHFKRAGTLAVESNGDGTSNIGVSLLSPGDSFCRSLGRMIATGRVQTKRDRLFGAQVDDEAIAKCVRDCRSLEINPAQTGLAQRAMLRALTTGQLGEMFAAIFEAAPTDDLPTNRQPTLVTRVR